MAALSKLLTPPPHLNRPKSTSHNPFTPSSHTKTTVVEKVALLPLVTAVPISLSGFSLTNLFCSTDGSHTDVTNDASSGNTLRKATKKKNFFQSLFGKKKETKAITTYCESKGYSMTSSPQREDDFVSITASDKFGIEHPSQYCLKRRGSFPLDPKSNAIVSEADETRKREEDVSGRWSTLNTSYTDSDRRGSLPVDLMSISTAYKKIDECFSFLDDNTISEENNTRYDNTIVSGTEKERNGKNQFWDSEADEWAREREITDLKSTIDYFKKEATLNRTKGILKKRSTLNTQAVNETPKEAQKCVLFTVPEKETEDDNTIVSGTEKTENEWHVFFQECLNIWKAHCENNNQGCFARKKKGKTNNTNNEPILHKKKFYKGLWHAYLQHNLDIETNNTNNGPILHKKEFYARWKAHYKNNNQKWLARRKKGKKKLYAGWKAEIKIAFNHDLQSWLARSKEGDMDVSPTKETENEGAETLNKKFKTIRRNHQIPGFNEPKLRCDRR